MRLNDGKRRGGSRQKRSRSGREVIKVCDCFIESIPCQVFLSPAGLDTHFDYPSPGSPYARLVVGGGHEDWTCVVSGLLHELGEVVLREFRLAFKCLLGSSDDTSAVEFRMSHAQYSAFADALGKLVCGILPALAEAWSESRTG